jgi:hypothetical protein
MNVNEYGYDRAAHNAKQNAYERERILSGECYRYATGRSSVAAVAKAARHAIDARRDADAYNQPTN